MVAKNLQVKDATGTTQTIRGLDDGSGNIISQSTPIDTTGTALATLANPMFVQEADAAGSIAVAGTGNASVSSATTIFSVDTSGYNGISVQVTSIGSATLAFEVSNDNSTWLGIYGWPLNFIGNLTPTTTGTGAFGFALQARYFRARVSSYGSGTQTVYYSLRRTYSLPYGNVVVGTANSGTSAVGPSVRIGGTYNSTLPSVSNSQAVDLQADTAGRLLVTGAVGSRTVEVSVTPTVTTANAYGANYVVGGLLTFSNAFAARGSGTIQSIYVTCKKVETSGFTFVLFNGNPSNTTWTDAAAAAINAADVTLVRPPIALNAYSGLGTHTILYATGLGISMAPGSTTLYGVLIANAALTNNFASTGDIASVNIEICQDY